jgi:rhomboid protease GluP
VAALFFGGIANLVVLTTLPPEDTLLGASGVVYWMGAVWLTLYFRLETRDKFSRRALKAIGVAVMLFVPETLHANVSYLCHFVGFLLGISWALVYFRLNREQFARAEVVEWEIEE